MPVYSDAAMPLKHKDDAKKQIKQPTFKEKKLTGHLRMQVI